MKFSTPFQTIFFFARCATGPEASERPEMRRGGERPRDVSVCWQETRSWGLRVVQNHSVRHGWDVGRTDQWLVFVPSVT